MGLKKILVYGALLGGTAGAGAATLANAGAPPLEHPQGVSLKETSVRTDRGAAFFPGYWGRSHRGGGLRGGK